MEEVFDGTVEVAGPPVAERHERAACQNLLAREALAFEVVECLSVAALERHLHRSPADLELVDELVGEAVGLANDGADLRRQRLVVERDERGQNLADAQLRLEPVCFLWRALRLRDAVAVSEVADRLGERRAVALHHPADGIASDVLTEVAPRVGVVPDDQAGVRFVRSPWAGALVAAACLLEVGYVTLDDVEDLHSFFDCFDVVVPRAGRHGSPPVI